MDVNIPEITPEIVAECTKYYGKKDGYQIVASVIVNDGVKKKETFYLENGASKVFIDGNEII